MSGNSRDVRTIEHALGPCASFRGSGIIFGERYVCSWRIEHPSGREGLEMGLNLVWCKVNLANRAIKVLSLQWKQRWQALECFSVQSQCVHRHEWHKRLETFRIHDYQSSYHGALFQNQCAVFLFYFIFCLFILGAYSAMLKAYFWLCTLDWLTNYMGCQKSNLCRQHARQLPYPQDYLSSPNMWHF